MYNAVLYVYYSKITFTIYNRIYNDMLNNRIFILKYIVCVCTYTYHKSSLDNHVHTVYAINIYYRTIYLSI